VATPEEHARGMEGWMKWAEECGSKLVDGRFSHDQRTTTKWRSPSGQNITGYSVLHAEDMKEAKQLLKGHPYLRWRAACSIEVYETMPITGM